MGLVDNHPPIRQALNEIYDQYGVWASVDRKRKSLGKFGRTLNADSNVETTVAQLGTVGSPESNETFVTTNAIDGVVSAGASGTDNQVLTIEGHTIDGSGNLTFVVQNVTLTGQTKATLATPLARATRAYVKDGTFGAPATTPEGPCYIYASSGVNLSSGVFRPIGLEISLRAAAESWAPRPLDPYIVVPANADVRAICVSNTNDAQATARMAGYLATIA